MLRILAVIFLLCLPILAQGQNLRVRPLERLYGTVVVGGQTVSINDSTFETIIGGVGAGVWLWEGIALEGELATSFSDDRISALRLDVPLQFTLNLRLESPPADGYSAYVQFGVARTEIDSRFTANTLAAPQSTLNSSLNGGHFGIGMVLHINRWLAADAGVSRLIYEDDSGVNLFRIGLRLTPARR